VEDRDLLAGPMIGQVGVGACNHRGSCLQSSASPARNKALGQF
jgi:hypothetical protein